MVDRRGEAPLDPPYEDIASASRFSPSSTLTRGSYPKSRRAAVMSYQCDVLSCDARNRVIGGSAAIHRDPYTVSSTRPASFAFHTDTAFVTGGSPAPSSTRLRNSHRSTGSPFEMKYAF